MTLIEFISCSSWCSSVGHHRLEWVVVAPPPRAMILDFRIEKSDARVPSSKKPYPTCADFAGVKVRLGLRLGLRRVFWPIGAGMRVLGILKPGFSMPRPRGTTWPSASVLEGLFARGLRLQDVAQSFGRSVGWVSHLRAVYGMTETRGSAPKPPFEGALLAIFLGSMMGDGSLLKTEERIVFSESHSVAQKGYVEWKRQQWGAEASRLYRYRPVLRIYDSGSHLWSREAWGFRVRTRPEFGQWERAFYSGRDDDRRVKQFPGEILEHLSPLLLAIWYMDDGCLVGNRWPGFACHERSHEVGIEVLRRFGISAEPNRARTAFGVRTKDMAHHLLSIVEPHMHEDLKYKMDPPCLFNDRRRRVVLDTNRVRELVQDGLTLRQLERELGWGEKFTKSVLLDLDLQAAVGEPQPVHGVRDRSDAVLWEGPHRRGRKEATVSRELLLEILAQERSMRRVAKALGVSESTVARMLDKHGIARVSKTVRRPSTSIVDVDNLVDLVGRQLPLREIARRLKCSRGAVQANCKKNKLSTRGASFPRVSPSTKIRLSDPEVERWDEVVGYPSYQVSTLGRVKSFRRKVPRILRPQPHRDGTVFVALMTAQGGVQRYVHHLVLEAFVGPRKRGQEARHLNQVPDDNRLENLVWGSKDGEHRRRVRPPQLAPARVSWAI